MKDKNGVKSFLIKVYYQERHSIQGTIVWLEEHKVQTFRSFIELLHLLQLSNPELALKDWGAENEQLKMIKGGL